MPAGQGDLTNLDTYNDAEEPDNTVQCPECGVDGIPAQKEGEGWVSWECRHCGHVFDHWWDQEDYLGEDESF